ncbi:MAG: hypothetical protein RL274_291 [Pseudomonadota bacterium]|jgi:hypothetical protein
MTRSGLMISTLAATLLATGAALTADQPGQKFQVSPAGLGMAACSLPMMWRIWSGA